MAAGQVTTWATGAFECPKCGMRIGRGETICGYRDSESAPVSWWGHPTCVDVAYMEQGSLVAPLPTANVTTGKGARRRG